MSMSITLGFLLAEANCVKNFVLTMTIRFFLHSLQAVAHIAYLVSNIKVNDFTIIKIKCHILFGILDNREQIFWIAFPSIFVSFGNS